jgi:putative SOS response-associated peptidase YedK
MCGRYVARADAATERYWSLITPWSSEFLSFNVAPSRPVPVVIATPEGRAGAIMRWGLIPFWAKGEPQKYSTINARAETVEKAASYRGPWARDQRCLFPVLGFYEWKDTPTGKQPYFIRLAGGEPFGLAGLWDRSTRADGTAVESCTIMTVDANPLVAAIHARRRMPVILTPGTAAAWLEGSKDDARALLAPYPAELMDAYAVSRRVNSPRNDEPNLIEPDETTAA